MHSDWGCWLTRDMYSDWGCWLTRDMHSDQGCWLTPNEQYFSDNKLQQKR